MKKGPPVKICTETQLAQSMHFFNEATGGIIPEIDLSTTFKRDKNYNPLGSHIYAREGNYTTSQAEKIVQCLDQSEDTLLFSSGMSALSTLMDTLKIGDHIIIQEPIYYAIADYIKSVCPKRGVELTTIHCNNMHELYKHIKKGKTKFVWIETPSNPHWINVDIKKISQITAPLECKLIVDATCSPACTTNTLGLGADICFQSTTKYLNGHSDALGGALSTNKTDNFWETITKFRNYHGSIMTPFNAWLLIRGLKTLFIRFQKVSENALQVAQYLSNHPKVEEVLYPGLKEHASYSIGQKQMLNGFGGMLSIKLNGGIEDTKKTVSNANIWMTATSLGSVESLIEHRKIVEGDSSKVEDNLLRLSVGIEAVEDLIYDIDQAIST